MNYADGTSSIADLDGDGLADYLVVDEKSGAVIFWRNGGRQDDGWSVSGDPFYLLPFFPYTVCIAFPACIHS